MLFSRDGDESSYWQQPYSAPIWPAASPVIFSVNGSSWNCELDACASFDVSGACASSVAESESSSTSSCGKSSVCAAAHSREGARSRGALLRFDAFDALRDALVHDASSHGKYCGAAVTCEELHSRSTQPGGAKLALTVRFGWFSGGIKSEEEDGMKPIGVQEACCVDQVKP